jgi:hypothetical protein
MSALIKRQENLRHAPTAIPAYAVIAPWRK